MVDPPGPGGRIHRGERRVRLADVLPSGHLRLDAVARYLQDVAADDVRVAGLADELAWVVRRTVIEVICWPRYDEVVELATWCSGVGAAWAERRTRIVAAAGAGNGHPGATGPGDGQPGATGAGDGQPGATGAGDGQPGATAVGDDEPGLAAGPAGTGGARSRFGSPCIETASLWVSLDPITMRPVPPSGRFAAVYGPAGTGRRVRTRLTLPGPARDELGPGRPWPLRRSDLDLLGHVNNAVAWAAVEDEVARVAPDVDVTGAQVEYRASIEATTTLVVRSRARPGEVSVWLSDDDRGEVLVTARVRVAGRGGRPRLLRPT